MTYDKESFLAGLAVGMALARSLGGAAAPPAEQATPVEEEEE